MLCDECRYGKRVMWLGEPYIWCKKKDRHFDTWSAKTFPENCEYFEKPPKIVKDVKYDGLTMIIHTKEVKED